MTMVSVILPTFNRAQLIGRAIESVLTQDHREIELIIVDDGSSDGTAAVIDDARTRDPRIRYIRQENAGAPTARNRGVAQARGEWIAFQDSDDVWNQGFLSAVLPLADENRVVFTSHSIVFRSGAVETVPPERVTSPDRVLRRTNVVSTQTTLLPTRLAKRHPFDTALARFQDWDLWLTLLESGVEFIHAPVDGVTLYRQSDSISEGAHSDRKASLRAILRKHRRALAKDPVSLARLVGRAYAPNAWVNARHRRRQPEPA